MHHMQIGSPCPCYSMIQGCHTARPKGVITPHHSVDHVHPVHPVHIHPHLHTFRPQDPFGRSLREQTHPPLPSTPFVLRIPFGRSLREPTHSSSLRYLHAACVSSIPPRCSSPGARPSAATPPSGIG